MRMTEAEFAQLKNPRIAANSCHRPPIKPDHIPSIGKTIDIPKRGKPNKTEAEYGRMLQMEFPGSDVRFEGMTFRMSNGHKYTPDWTVDTELGMLFVEVKARGKNGFRHPSYQRARLAFDQCTKEYPVFLWRWAEKIKGEWDVKTTGAPKQK